MVLKVAAFTGEMNDPSSRYRIRQFIDILKEHEIEVDDYFSKKGKYPPMQKSKRIIWGLSSLLERFIQVIRVNRKNYDCVFLQREMISTLNTFENMTIGPRILDVDDAIHLHRNGSFIQKIAEKSDAVICGNRNLAKVFEKWNKHIYIVPTAVDTSKYMPSPKKKDQKKITIGWVGTSGGFNYLYKIEKALSQILSSHENVELLIVSNSEPKFNSIKNVRFMKWNEKTEVENFQDIDIGIMPLHNDEWSRGKCSYKMLLYMSCEIPVVVSPVGMNADVLEMGNIGFGAKNDDSDWMESLETLIKNQSIREEMGKAGRKVVLDHYSMDVIAKQISSILKKVAN
jgi:glycosyltransferase involved in cell wall biosynthesis